MVRRRLSTKAFRCKPENVDPEIENETFVRGRISQITDFTVF